LKQYKPEGVTDEMIDEDIALANTVSTYVSNKELNDIANQINATFGDTRYNQIIKNAINLRDRLNDQTQASENSTKAIAPAINSIACKSIEVTINFSIVNAPHIATIASLSL